MPSRDDGACDERGARNAAVFAGPKVNPDIASRELEPGLQRSRAARSRLPQASDDEHRRGQSQSTGN